MKRYWIEKVVYPNGVDGFADCFPLGSYKNKDEAIKVFNKLVKDKGNKNILISLYKLEYGVDNLIKQK